MSRSWQRLFALASTASLAVFATAASAGTGKLSADPATTVTAATPLVPGLSSLGNGADLYVPPGIAGPRPLLLLFPGTGGNGRAMIDALRGHADREHFLLLAFTPSGGNFDAVDAFFDDYEARLPAARRTWPEPTFGPDVRRIDQALARLFERIAIDRSRIGLLGFSHGASYALSLGTANPLLFASIQALSPGILVIGGGVQGGQALFLAHGRTDQVQPFRRTAGFVPRLRSLGYRVEFAPFAGGHALPSAILERAIAHFLATPAGADRIRAK